MQIKEISSLTQKTALFYTAAELSRRGYNVSVVDDTVLQCIYRGVSFFVKVSGQKFKKSWIVQQESAESTVYVFVYIPKDEYENPEFFILTDRELKREIKNKKLRSVEELLNKDLISLSYSTLLKYSDKWISIKNLYGDRD